MKKAQINMRAPLPKRFYKETSVARDEAGLYRVLLDGKPLRTPTKNLLALPSEAAAILVAEEFDAQKKEIDPSTMPVTRIVNSAIDGVSADVDGVVADLVRFSETDLLCYRAEGPDGLAVAQAKAWQPVLDWAAKALGAKLLVVEGIMHVAQPRETIAAIAAEINSLRDPFLLSCVHVMTTLTGSVMLGLAVANGRLSADEAFEAAHVDEDWNIRLWGEDAEAAERRAYKKGEMLAAARLYEALPGR
ncbi:ATP12 family chaperone protein [Limoniibacter endophyticus]|nr:ATP12 family protein [Limoniibacter endophyticus]